MHQPINQLEVKKFRKDDRQTDQISELLTPISPPANEKIHIDLVDPIPTPSNSIDNIFIPPTLSKQSIRKQINEELSSTVIQSPLCPSESTIHAILELGHSPPIDSATTNSTSYHITRYYRVELLEHLLN